MAAEVSLRRPARDGWQSALTSRAQSQAGDSYEHEPELELPEAQHDECSLEVDAAALVRRDCARPCQESSSQLTHCDRQDAQRRTDFVSAFAKAGVGPGHYLPR